ncbi:hypothetical protein CRI93_03285 [Longimonas halophila]|uniref:Lipoprotein n=1 Tax=Longimonas halophila TaxID=1469170 RepID=A0A2H3NP30_9BACT|nr:hypothetical protein [Longimonas halophila]PEN08794.1 hypothetical protein CRI93_03285 [Longimonas halophila]
MLTHIRTSLAVGLLLLAASFSLTGCDLFGSDDGSAVDVGVVDWEAEQASVETPASSKLNLETFEPLTAPDTFQANTTFEVVVRTITATSCYEAARTDIDTDDARVVGITPYDHDPTASDVVCPDAISTVERTLDLQFDTPGDALIRLNGQRVIGNDFSNRDDTVLEHDVTVVE